MAEVEKTYNAHLGQENLRDPDSPDSIGAMIKDINHQDIEDLYQTLSKIVNAYEGFLRDSETLGEVVGWDGDLAMLGQLWELGDKEREAQRERERRGLSKREDWKISFCLYDQQGGVTENGAGVWTIEEWIAKARDNAVASAVKKPARLALHRAQQGAEDLRKNLSPADLNTYVARYMNPETVKKLETDAVNATADPGLDKALWFAMEKPEDAAAVAKRAKQ